jgi:LuxR family transcriptional regulator, maltose regulon positive regulatory protein
MSNDNSLMETKLHRGALPALPLLATKLYLPPSPAAMVLRPRLVARLRERGEERLTLISAPPGFGKTTLLAEWLAGPKGGRRSAGWVSLDPGDNDPALFWSYAIAALQRVRPGLGAEAMARLHSPQPPAIEEVLAALINEIDAGDGDVALVLDDFHVIEAEAIHQAVAFLIDNLPARLRLIVASRTDPPLPLGRLRARGQLVELRAADLRFTPREASAFLNRAMRLGLSPADVTTLEKRTEGWIAGLQLAALSMRGREDVSGFLTAFSGDNRFVADYLVEEVLQRQPEDVRSFLFETCILERLSGPLCDAVTGARGSVELLERLERGNLFIVPLDDGRRWYRYHHLFADVLRARSRVQEPDRFRALHQRASAWFEGAGYTADAIRHALAAGAAEHAADLIQAEWPSMEKSGHYATWLAWVRELPEPVIRRRPVLIMGYAGALLNAGELEGGEERLRQVERWLEGTAVPGAQPGGSADASIGVDDALLRTLAVDLATARTYLAQARGDVAETVVHARQVLQLVPDGDHLARGPGAALLGLAFWASGDLDAAFRSLAEALDGLQRAGDPLSAIGGSYVLGDMLVARGRLREAAATYEHALARAALERVPNFLGLPELHVALAELHRERGDLDAAERHLRSAGELREGLGHPGNPSRFFAATARVLEARGEMVGALELLDEAERHRIRSPIPDVRPVPAMRARVLTALGRLDEAGAWVERSGVAADDEPAYMREFDHLTLARVLLGRHAAGRGASALSDAGGLLRRLLPAAQAGGRTGSVIEILTLAALVHQAEGDTPRALAALEQALTLAEPEGYLRVFMDEGQPLRRLLRHAAARGLAEENMRRLLTAFDAPQRPSPAPGSAAPGLTRPLTRREIEILRLMAGGMQNQEIATHLFVSTSTVKRHVANAYGKLDVGNRTAAVARANELNLL